jgi:hypothetical protein
VACTAMASTTVKLQKKAKKFVSLLLSKKISRRDQEKPLGLVVYKVEVLISALGILSYF